MATALQIINDPIHGSIQLHPLLVKIIDTPQFQRLRDIKQLGVCYWVYPGASHNRFEHCIGVSYLCGQMIDTLKALHPQLITDHESLCIKIAGLCRDLGYGPFSHFFHEVLIPKLMSQQSHQSQRQGSSSAGNLEVKSNFTTNWARDASCKMFDFMLKENEELKTDFDKALEPGYQVFIKDLIRGKNSANIKETCSFNDSKEVKKAFLYEIVSNLRNRIDCNKFDYIARDCHNVGFQSGFNWQRYLQNIRIMESDGQLQICVRDKEALNLYELFRARWRLYHQVYRHKTKASIEDILASAFLNAEFKLEISKLLTDDGLLSEASEAKGRYTELTDHTLCAAILVLEKESKQSQEESKQSQEQLKQPQLESEQSQQESKQSQQELKQPQLETKKPEEEPKQPEEEPKQPEEEAKQPEEESKRPEEESKQPEEEPKQPEEESKQPEEESKRPEEEAKQPEEESKRPEEEAKQHEEESKQPQQKSKQSREDSNISEETLKFQKAKELLLNIRRRKLYKFCGYAELKNPQHKYPCRQENEEGHTCPDDIEIAKEIASKLNEKVGQEQILVSITYFHYGKEDKNPMESVQFFNKSLELQKFNTDQISYMLPQKFDERFVRVYAKAQKDDVQDCFKEWCVEHREELQCYGLYDDQSGSTQVTHQ